jgi:UDP:flavonoid glycosyltransferase YjiC (YdhE family)
MITHGGLGSVKECIALGVPMNVYPLKDDQQGNGARVVHHRLGRAGRVRDATVDSIHRAIKETLREGAPGMPAMRDALLRFEAEGRGVAAVERALSR